MNFMDAIEHVFINYAKFDGCARRIEYWYFQLFRTSVLFGLLLFSFTVFLAFLIPVFYLGTIVPSLAVSWRRFHDVGRGGWWYFISLIPIIGWIFMVIWLAQDRQPGGNQYGPNPKGIGNAGAYGAYTDGGAGSLPGQGHLAVQCVAGPLQGQIYPIRGNEIVFGRESICAVRMPEGTPGISRRHACIRWQQGMPMLIDLGSSFGTFLADGKQLPPNYPEPVAAGTRFYLGNRGNTFQIIVI